MKQQFVEGKRLLKGGILCVAVVWCNGVRGGVGTNEKKLQSRKGPEDIGMPCGLFGTGAQELYDRVDKKKGPHPLLCLATSDGSLRCEGLPVGEEQAAAEREGLVEEVPDEERHRGEVEGSCDVAAPACGLKVLVEFVQPPGW